MSDPQDVRKVNVCRIKPFMAPLLPTSSDASTQMESSFDSPNVASDTANNLISKMLTFKLPSITSPRKRMILQELSYTKEAWPIRPTMCHQGLEP